MGMNTQEKIKNKYVARGKYPRCCFSWPDPLKHLIRYLKAWHGFVPCEKEQVALKDRLRMKLLEELHQNSHRARQPAATNGGSSRCNTHTKPQRCFSRRGPLRLPASPSGEPSSLPLQRQRRPLPPPAAPFLREAKPRKLIG